MKRERTTNELEFQGSVLSWLNAELSRRPGLGLEMVTQEPSKLDRKRNDVVVWRSRNSGVAFMTIELKTPETSITDPALLNDACHKAQRWHAPYFALWNMQSAELFLTPADGKSPSPRNRIKLYPPAVSVRSVDDWLKPKIRRELMARAVEILDDAWLSHSSEGAEFVIEASVFVDRLSKSIAELRAEVTPTLKRAARRSRKLRKRLREIAAVQGSLGFVDDIHAALAGQFCYRIVGQILFYYALRRREPNLRPLEPRDDLELATALRPFWDDVRRYDYEALFAPSELETLIPLSSGSQDMLRDLIAALNRYDWNSLRDDVLGAVFERLIPHTEQILLGQFYTPAAVADLLVAMALDRESPLVLDPACGSGTFLLRAYQYLQDTGGLRHAELLPLIWGFDLSPFAAELAVINLFRQDLAEFHNFPRVLSGDFFDRRPGEEVQFPPARNDVQKKVTLRIPQFDAIVANPPYLRSQQQDDLDPKYKNRMYSLVVEEHGVQPPAKTDLFVFFVYHAYTFLKPGGRIAFVTSASWLTSEYGSLLREFIMSKFRLIAVLASDVESFFSQVEQNTTLFLAEKRQPSAEKDNGELIRFVTLKKTLEDQFPPGPTRWAGLGDFADEVESYEESYEDERLRVRVVSMVDELDALRSGRDSAKNWSIYLRAPRLYFELVRQASGRLTHLGSIAEPHLGFKSLQNQFYYVGESTIGAFGIESEFLQPILRLSDLNASDYVQTPAPMAYVFACDGREEDIRGTGALSYILDMESRPSTTTKQSAGPKTIREALEKQGGALWYSPKAVPHEAHIWVRKAFDATFAPFFFPEPQVLDQRCNYLEPNRGVPWEVIAALLTSSLFALSIEVTGSASMGAGALEIPTRLLARVMVPDPRKLKPADIKKLVRFARAVWSSSSPINWRDGSSKPGKDLQSLDAFVLEMVGSSISVADLHDAVRETTRTRLRLGELKAQMSKSAESADIGTVAQAIIRSLRTEMNAVRFPESFIPVGETISTIEFDDSLDLLVTSKPLLTEIEVLVQSPAGEVLLKSTMKKSVGETLIRALMMGRRKFTLPCDEKVASAALEGFFARVLPIARRIEEECAASSLGTRFEGKIKTSAYESLGWSIDLLKPDMFGRFRIPSRKDHQRSG